ncbi:MAG: tryptophan-rich sensory protein [Oscillospiraceae bacterium]|nr:tryptophan-rich sensory protein [Oscillospiraceae bacterium]
MRKQWKTLVICIAIPLAVGVLSALLTRDSMQTFETINKPKLSPPGWLFPVAWTILYILMGIASFPVVTSKKPNGSALITYGLQLIFNFFWSIIFFNWGLYLFAFIWLVILWILILKTTIKFYRISEPAGYLMIPYLLWVTFAGYLNLVISILN